MDKQINHDKYHDESQTSTHRLSKLPDDGDPWAPNNLLTPEQKKKQLNLGGPSNRQEATVVNVCAIIESDARPIGVQLNKAA